MIDKKLKSINIRRILDRAINDVQIINEQKSFTCVDILRELRAETSESRITEALRILVKEGIFRDKRTFLGRPPRYLRREDGKLMYEEQIGRKNYYLIVQNSSALEKIFNIYFDDGSEKFLSSLYINNIVKKRGLAVVYDIIKPYLERSEFRRIASNSLLALPATAEEYKGESRFIDEYIFIYDKECKIERPNGNISSEIDKDLCSLVSLRPRYYFIDEQLRNLSDNISCCIKPIRSNRIKMLAGFDPLYAVPFYRKTIHTDIKNLFKKLYEKNLVTHGLVQFLEYDSYLSPFTSYPIYSPSLLLFSRPFQRIFEDVYLMDESDLSKMILRAFTIYKNFDEILFEYFRNHVGNLPASDQYIRQFIFQWNGSCANLESVFDYLSVIYGEKIGSGKYHIGIRGSELQVVDLVNNEPVPDYYEAKMILIDGADDIIEEENRPPIIDDIFAGFKIDTDDPYVNLSSCSWFEELKDCPASISMEEIHLDLSLMLNYGLTHDDPD